MLNVSLWADILPAIAVVMTRPLLLFTVLPYLDSTVIPGAARTTVIFALSVPMMVAWVPFFIDNPYAWDHLLLILLKESLIGMILGFLGGIPFYIAESIGFAVDNQRGTTMASVFNPLSGESTSPLGILLNNTAIALFFISGGFIVFLSLFYGTYFIWPMNSILPTLDERFINYFLGVADHILRATLLYASPMLIVMFMSDFGLGLMNRFAQQLNVFTISMPIKSGLALFILILYMTFLFGFLQDEFETLYTLITHLKDIF